MTNEGSGEAPAESDIVPVEITSQQVELLDRLLNEGGFGDTRSAVLLELFQRYLRGAFGEKGVQ